MKINEIIDIKSVWGNEIKKNENSLFLNVLTKDKKETLVFLVWSPNKKYITDLSIKIDENKSKIISELNNNLINLFNSLEFISKNEKLELKNYPSPIFSTIIKPIINENWISDFEKNELDCNYSEITKDIVTNLKTHTPIYEEYEDKLNKNINFIPFSLTSNILTTACKENHLDVIPVILRHPEIDLNFLSEYYKWGATPLMICSLYNKIQIAKLLIDDSRTLINYQNKEGKTALMLAVLYGKLQMIEFLLSQKEIDLDIKDLKGKTVFDLIEELIEKNENSPQISIFLSIKQLFKNLNKSKEGKSSNENKKIDNKLDLGLLPFFINLLSSSKAISEEEHLDIKDKLVNLKSNFQNENSIKDFLTDPDFKKLFYLLKSEFNPNWEFSYKDWIKFYLKHIILNKIITNFEIVELIENKSILNLNEYFLEYFDNLNDLFLILTEDEKLFVKEKRTNKILQNIKEGWEFADFSFVKYFLKNSWPLELRNFVFKYINNYKSLSKYFLEILNSIKENQFIELLVDEYIFKTENLLKTVFNYEFLKEINNKYLKEVLLKKAFSDFNKEFLLKNELFLIFKNSIENKVPFDFELDYNIFSSIPHYNLGKFLVEYINYISSLEFNIEKHFDFFIKFDSISSDSDFNEQIINIFINLCFKNKLYSKEEFSSDKFYKLLDYIKISKVYEYLKKAPPQTLVLSLIMDYLKKDNKNIEYFNNILLKLINLSDEEGVVKELDQDYIINDLFFWLNLRELIYKFLENTNDFFDSYKLFNLIKGNKLIKFSNLQDKADFYYNFLVNLIKNNNSVSWIWMIYSSILSELVQEENSLSIFKILEEDAVSKNSLKSTIEPTIKSLKDYMKKISISDSWFSKLFNSNNKINYWESWEQFYKSLKEQINKSSKDLNSLKNFIENSSNNLENLQKTINPFIELSEKINNSVKSQYKLEIPPSILTFKNSLNFSIVKNNILLQTIEQTINNINNSFETLNSILPNFIINDELEFKYKIAEKNKNVQKLNNNINTVLDNLTQLSSNL